MHAFRSTLSGYCVPKTMMIGSNCFKLHKKTSLSILTTIFQVNLG